MLTVVGYVNLYTILISVIHEMIYQFSKTWSRLIADN